MFRSASLTEAPVSGFKTRLMLYKLPSNRPLRWGVLENTPAGAMGVSDVRQPSEEFLPWDACTAPLSRKNNRNL